MSYIAINKKDLDAPIVKACIQAYGCMIEKKKIRAYLFTFGNHEIIAFLLKQEHIKYRTIKIC